MKVEIKVVKEKGYPLVLPITKKEKKFEKEFFEDIQFRRVFEKGKEIIYGSFKKNEDLKFGARLIKFLKIEKVKKVWIDCSKLNSRFLVEGILLASYEFNKYKKKKKEEKIEVFLVNGKKEEVKLAKLISEAVYFARDLENEPANKLYPAKFVEIAKKKLKGMKKIKIKVFDEKELEKKGFGGIIAVGKGSSNKPRFLVIEYKGNGKERSIALVGKGVCFDAGGIHLKPSGYIEDMKMDMSGAAVVLSLIWLASKTNLKINLVGAIPLVENVPSANATKPGDIIKMYDGQTVEVVNTDAEGRLILADALAYVEKNYKPKLIIDFATLTGSIIVALGYYIAGIFGNDKENILKLIKIGKKVKEYVWKLPLPKFYEELIKGEISDLKNIVSPNYRGAGSITAALFLKQFVKKSKWIHLDIAGTSIFDKEWEWMTKGGTGFGIRLIFEFLKKFQK